MSILNVNQIQPVGSGQTVTISATNISAGSATVTAGTFSGAFSSSGVSTFSDTVNVGAGKSIRLYGATSGYSDIVAAAGSASTTFTLPANGGSASQYLQTDGAGGLSWATVAGVSVAVIADQKANNTAGGTFTSGAWRTRDLNTEISDTGSIVSISSNQFTLGAGTYYIIWAAPAGGVAQHISRLYNITASSTVAQSSNAYDYPDPGLPLDQGYSIGFAVTAPTSSTVYEIQHYGNTTRSTDGFGIAANFGASEQYTTVTIVKVA